MSDSLVGTRVREIRRSQQISQKALAQKIGISPSYLNLIEHNRRRIAGGTLRAISEALDVSPERLSSRADASLIANIQEAAARNPDSRAETEKLAQFIGRYPGFAALIHSLFDQGQTAQNRLLTISDTMANDPFFAEAMHMMLSSVTTIRTTTEILSETPDIPADIMSRFLGNLADETARLSNTASDVLDHFEPTEAADSGPDDPNSFRSLLSAGGNVVPELEGSATEAQSWMETHSPSAEDPDAFMLRAKRYASVAERLPLTPFLRDAQACGFNPGALAAQTGAAFEHILYRLAHLPANAQAPEFGYFEIDAAGGVLRRKQLPSFALPENSAACPLWPVYTALSHPNQPQCYFLDTPTGERLLAYAVSYFAEQPGLSSPGRLNAAMLVTPEYDPLLGDQRPATLNVGLQCAICPRETCTARRVRNIIR